MHAGVVVHFKSSSRQSRRKRPPLEVFLCCWSWCCVSLHVLLKSHINNPMPQHIRHWQHGWCGSLTTSFQGLSPPVTCWCISDIHPHLSEKRDSSYAKQETCWVRQEADDWSGTATSCLGLGFSTRELLSATNWAPMWITMRGFF